MKELLSNVANCGPCGIPPLRRLQDTLKNAKKVSCDANYRGTTPDSLLCERSNDSSSLRFPRDGGI